MPAHPPQEPAWKATARYRIGPRYRVQKDRFMHIKQLGWFVHVRGEFTAIEGITTSDGLVGPFTNRARAYDYLRQAIQAQGTPA